MECKIRGIRYATKTIYCKVEEEKKELFSKAQEKWRDIQHLDGFMDNLVDGMKMRHVYLLYGKIEMHINHL